METGYNQCLTTEITWFLHAREPYEGLPDNEAWL